MKIRTSIVVATGLAALALSAWAQYPEKPIHLLIPLPAGGPSDVAARNVSQALSQMLGQQIVVENKPGANGAIAAQALLAAPADGYTLMWAPASMVALPMMQKGTPFGSFSDFTPVSAIGRFTFALFVHPAVPARSVAELVAHAKANPGKLGYATGTTGEFIATAQLNRAAGMSMLRVPYKGGAQAMPDVVAGRVQVYITPISLGLPYAKDGRLRLLATLSSQRSAVARDVPTIAEAGVAGVSVPTWQGIVGPPKMPRDAADRLQRAIGQVLQDPEVRAQFDRQAIEVEGSTPDAFAALIRDDLLTWTQFVRENEIVAE